MSVDTTQGTLEVTPEGAPEWAQNLVRSIQEQTVRMQALEERVSNPLANTPTSQEFEEQQSKEKTAQKEELVAPYGTPIMRRSDLLPNPPEFEGKKSDYSAWVSQIYAKLQVDRRDESESVRFWYIFSRLRGKALHQVSPWVAIVQGTTAATPEGLMAQLSLAYDDPQSKERAANKLNSLRQGTKSFAVFLAEYERTVLAAGGADWSDTVKKTFLSNGISTELREAIVAVPTPATYGEYCSLLHSVSQNKEALQKYYKWVPDRTKRGHRQPETEDAMDWEPNGSVNEIASSEPRAQWVSERELKRRREEGACLRCGKKGHLVRDCKLQPARRPSQVSEVRTKKRTTVNRAEITRTEEVSSSEEEELSENE